MNRFIAGMLMAAVAGGGVALFSLLAVRAPASTSIEPAPSRTPVSRKVLGVSSCLGSGCHGQREESGTAAWKHSYSIWSDRDPHHGAYEALYLPRSQRMIALLAGREMAPESEEYRQELVRQCTECHSTGHATPGDVGLLASGVSCESCHGAAGEWRDSHYLPGAPRPGMVYTADLGVRAKTCVQCHLGPGAASNRDAGSPTTQDVNHRLYAAGHPRLDFEFTAYLDALPAHWDKTADEREQKSADGQSRGPRKNFAAEAWLAGQRASMSGAARLTEFRAVRGQAGDAESDWPEFAEYDCTSCHHGLRAESFRRSPGEPRFGASKPGQYLWGNWHFAFVEELVSEDVRNRVFQLQKQTGRPAPDAAGVASEAARLAAAVDALPGSEDPLPTLVNAVLQRSERRFSSWDEATQWYLAARACVRGLSDARTPEGSPAGGAATLVEQLDAFEQLLNFNRGLPADSDELWDSPWDFDPTDPRWLERAAGVRRAVEAEAAGVLGERSQATGPRTN